LLRPSELVELGDIRAIVANRFRQLEIRVTLLTRPHEPRVDRPRRKAVQLQRARPSLEAAQSRANVVEEARFADFAIVDDVQTDVPLALDDIPDSAAHTPIERLALFA